MQNYDPETLETKFTISEAAVECYVEQDGTFAFKDIARKTALSVGEIFNYFPDKQSILEFYYTSLIIRYQMMIEEIDGFEDYTISEKLSNFAFSSFDMMREQQEFVRLTFGRVVECRLSKTEYEIEIEALFRGFFEEDDLISSGNQWLMNRLCWGFLRRQYLLIVRFWLQDPSDGQEKTMVLVDKSTALLQEVLYNAVIDRSLDLLKFLASNKFFVENIPFVKNIFSNIEIRE